MEQQNGGYCVAAGSQPPHSTPDIQDQFSRATEQYLTSVSQEVSKTQPDFSLLSDSLTLLPKYQLRPCISLLTQPGNYTSDVKLVFIQSFGRFGKMSLLSKQRFREEQKVPQVKTPYPYQAHGLDVKKGEVMFLLDNTYQDWWNIWKNNGDNGYVPANYVKEIDPKILSVVVKKPIVVKDVYFFDIISISIEIYSGKEPQIAIKDSYDLLNKLSRERQEILQVGSELEEFGTRFFLLLEFSALRFQQVYEGQK